MSEIVRVVYTIKAERLFERGGHLDSAEFHKRIMDYIVEQVSKCQLGHKVEIKVASRTPER